MTGDELEQLAETVAGKLADKLAGGMLLDGEAAAILGDYGPQHFQSQLTGFGHHYVRWDTQIQPDGSVFVRLIIDNLTAWQAVLRPPAPGPDPA